MEAATTAAASPVSETVRFHLFVAGETPRTRRAIENLERLVRAAPMWRCEVEVIDVLLFPERAEEERILATPTLIKASPLPRRRVTGDLSDSEKLLSVMGPFEAIGDRPRDAGVRTGTAGGPD